MSMFDWISSSFPLPKPFMGLNNTKDIEEGIGGTMSNYWVDPTGYLWVGIYHETHTFENIEEDDPCYNTKFSWLNHKWIPTGKHGKYRVHPITKYIEVYPERWENNRKDWPRIRLHFKEGLLQDFKVLR